MNTKLKVKIFAIAGCIAFGAGLAPASAQTSIQMRSEEAPVDGPNPFAPLKPAAPAVVAPKELPPMFLLPGKTVSVQLMAMAKASGWDLVWDAADFSVDQKVALSSDFTKAVGIVIESANSEGTHLKAMFYRGNNVVRITEF